MIKLNFKFWDEKKTCRYISTRVWFCGVWTPFIKVKRRKT